MVNSCSPEELPAHIKEVVGKVSHQDRWDISGKITDVESLLPGLEGVDQQIAFDALYLCIDQYHLQLISNDSEEKWLHARHPLNDRGDEATVEARKASVEMNGIFMDVRSGAWAIPKDKELSPIQIKPTTECHFVHYASLNDGARRAYESDAQKKNTKVNTYIYIPEPG